MIISDIRFLPFLSQNIICETCRNAKLILKTFLASLCWAKVFLHLPWTYFCTCQGGCINVFLSIYLNNFVCICTVLFLKLFHLRRSLFLITAVHRVWKGYSEHTQKVVHNFIFVTSRGISARYIILFSNCINLIISPWCLNVGTSHKICDLNLKVVLNISFNLFIEVKYMLMIRVKTQHVKHIQWVFY